MGRHPKRRARPVRRPEYRADAEDALGEGTLCVPEAHGGLELDEFLTLYFPWLGKGWIRRRIREGRVLVDGEAVVPARRLRANQLVILDFDAEEPPPTAPVAPVEPLELLHEDEELLVIDKPPGLACEPERWARDAATLAGALLALAAERRAAAGEPSFRPRLVHRLDKDTSGAVVVARDLDTERRLRGAFERGEVEKTYLALVEGEHPLADGEEETIDLPIASDARRSGRMRVHEGEGKRSRTVLRVERRFRGFTLLACSPLTGRTHQIRVHLAASGFPLAVDPLYGRRDELLLSEIKAGYRPKAGRVERPLLDRLSLHAYEVGLPPLASEGDRGRRRVVRAPVPKDLERTLKQLEKVRPRTR